MERASKAIRGIGLPEGMLDPERLACGAWPQAVGRKIAVHTRAAKLVRDRLVVEVEDAVWQRQLWALRSQILRNVERSVGPGLVAEIEFRVVPRRRPPQLAVTAAGASTSSSCAPGAGDEANLIDDPILRTIYRTSRKKALA